MISAIFYQNIDSAIVGFSVSGHADSAEYGRDIVCAGVSAMSALTVNTLEEVFHVGGKTVSNDSGLLTYSLPNNLSSDEFAVSAGILKGFLIQLKIFVEQYPKNIKIKINNAE